MNNVSPPIDLPLRDIHLPDPIAWWPLAFGWWLVFAIGLVFVLLMILFIRRWVRPTLRKEATKTLNAIEASYQSCSSAHNCVSEISILLRRIVISRDPKNAGITGTAWLQLLDFPDQKSFSEGVGRILLTAPYQPDIDDHDVVELLTLCRKVVNRL